MIMMMIIIIILIIMIIIIIGFVMGKKTYLRDAWRPPALRPARAVNCGQPPY